MNAPLIPDVPADFAGQVPLFPLSNVVAFPHSMLPLHIFESRYREMFGDALAGDQLIAMATLLPGYEIDYYSRPPVAPIICVGRIARYHQNDNGTYDFLLLGLQRARIDHEITPVRSYRRAAVDLLQDSTEADAVADELGPQLTARLQRHAPQLGRLLSALGKHQLALGLFTDIVAHHLDLDTPIKLQLLEELSPAARARLLIQHLSSRVVPEEN
jgi:Lon protease-like protein